MYGPIPQGKVERQKDKEKTRDSKGKWAEERRADRNTHTEVVPVRELKKEADRRGEGKREKGAAGTEADTQTETSSGAGEAPVKRGTWPGSLEEPRVPSLVTKAVSATGHSGPARVNWEEVGTECGYWEQLRLKRKKERTGAREFLAHREPLFYSEHRLKSSQWRREITWEQRRGEN